jgi:hypothetical protein
MRSESKATPVLDYAKPDVAVESWLTRPLRAIVGIGALTLWFAVTMMDATPNTSWEHHAFAGPFIMLKQSHTPGEYAFSVFLLAGIVGPLCRWIWTGKIWGIIVAIIVFAGTVCLSILFAQWASC